MLEERRWLLNLGGMWLDRAWAHREAVQGGRGYGGGVRPGSDGQGARGRGQRRPVAGRAHRAPEHPLIFEEARAPVRDGRRSLRTRRKEWLG